MSEDERAIRELVKTWMEASHAEDIDKLLSLISDDVVFEVVGQKPFGKKEFEAASRAQRGQMKFEGQNEILEIKVLGDWAYMRNALKVTVFPKDKAPVRRSGHTLTILHKQQDGHWVLTRDANTMTSDPA